ncbi:hypothetical protein [Streptomyces sp. NPDC052701]|uniref:hypothetical protein n=1 Tax=Streptomyces sp. NPDC052701 TaxID=3155533 RepID=UPI00341FE74C
MTDLPSCAHTGPQPPAGLSGRLPRPRPDRPVPGPAARTEPPTMPLLAGTEDTDPAETHIVRGID